MEPKDPELLSQLKAKQISVQETIERVAVLRRTAPKRLAAGMAERLKRAAADTVCYSCCGCCCWLWLSVVLRRTAPKRLAAGMAERVKRAAADKVC
jgi:hypothetical protein